MKNTNVKRTKWLTIAGCLMIGIVLVVLIGNRLIPEEPADQVLLPEGSQSDVTVNPNTEKENDVVVAPNVSQSEITDSGADASGTDQTIQEDVSKPPEPSKEQLADPSQKPDTSGSTNHGSGNSTSDSDSSQSGGGLPGFDNVPDGGPNQVIEVDGDGDINKQVGEM